jgi:diacylglycerol kinase-like protein
VRVNGSPPGASLGLIVNATARAVKRRHLGRRPFWLPYVPARLVRLTRSLEELDAAVAAFREEDVRVVAVLGGDGSLHHLVDAVLRCYAETEAPLVLALAGGTMNGLARALGTAGAPERVLRAALAHLAGDGPPVRAQHVLRVADALDGRFRHGFSFATGLVYRAFQEYYRASQPGIVDAVRASLLPLKAALVGSPLFYAGVQLDVRSGGAPWLPESPHTLVASVMDRPLLWFEPFGAPLSDAAAFHLAATSMRPREIVPRLWSIFRGRCRHPRLRIDRSRDATVRGNIGYLIDGDLYPGGGAVDVRLTVGPRLRFLVPDASSRAACSDRMRAMTTRR